MAVTTEPTRRPSIRPPGVDGPSEFAQDPFVRRLASGDTKRRLQSIADLRRGLRILDDQRERAEEADAYYDGDVGVTFASQQIRKLLTKQGVNDLENDFNYARIPVDVIANTLKIAAVKAVPELDEDDDEVKTSEATRKAREKAAKRAERAIKKLRKVNQLDAEEKSLHKSASKHGDAYLFVWPVEDASGRVVSVDMRVNTAHNVAFVYDEEDPLKVAYVIKSWEVLEGDDGTGETPGAKPRIRANLYYPGADAVVPLVDDVRPVRGPLAGAGDDESDSEELREGGAGASRRAGAGRAGLPGRVERWVTKPGGAPDKIESWSRVHDDDADIDEQFTDQVAADEFGDEDTPLDRDDIPSPWGLTWFHFRNDRPEGVPEHRNAYGPQELINKLVAAHAATIDYQSFPQRYLLADPKIDDPLHNMIDPDHPEDDDDDPEGEGGTSGLSADPGVVWKLWGKSAGEFGATDPQNFMGPLDRYIKAMAELTDIPQHAFSKASADMPSGESLRVLDRPRVDKGHDRQDRYGPVWCDAYELALNMLGITGVDVDVRWVPISRVEDLNGMQVLQAKRDLGVPSEILLSEVGYPDEQTSAWLKDSSGDSLEARVALLGQLGTAVQALAAGVKEGVVDEPGAQALVSRMIRLLAEGTADPTPGPDSLPMPTFREPPPTNPAMAAVEAQAEAAKIDPMRAAQVKQAEVGAKAAEVGIEQTKASTEATRTGTKMMQSGQQAGQPAKKAAPRKVAGRR